MFLQNSISGLYIADDIAVYSDWEFCVCACSVFFVDSHHRKICVMSSVHFCCVCVLICYQLDVTRQISEQFYTSFATSCFLEESKLH